MNYPVHRTPEQGHTAKCQAKALIEAIENYRDAYVEAARNINIPTLADVDFRVAAQENLFLTEADGYLRDGITSCVCPDLTDRGPQFPQALQFYAIWTQGYGDVTVELISWANDGGLVGQEVTVPDEAWIGVSVWLVDPGDGGLYGPPTTVGDVVTWRS